MTHAAATLLPVKLLAQPLARIHKKLIYVGLLLQYSPQLMETARLELEPLSGDARGQVIRLNGKLSLETVNTFIQTMRAEPAVHLILDMSGVTFLDSSGVGALVSIFVSRKHVSKTLVLSGLTKQGVAVMQVSGLMKLIPTYPTTEEALNASN